MTKLVGLAIVTAVAFGCGKKPGDAGGKPVVAASIFPLYDLTRRVAGDRVKVMIVLPPGKSEHSYEPTPQETVELSAAKVGFLVGLQMDPWVEPVLRDAKLVKIGDKVPTLKIDVEPIGEDEHEHEHGGEKPTEHHDEKDHDEHEHHHELGAADPHVWMDPDRMQPVIDMIATELATLDPAGKDEFAKNAAKLKGELKTLDTTIQTRAKAWTKRTIVTFHGSMSYFAKRYDLRIAAVVEPTAGKEPTADYIIDVLAAIKRGNAAALFTEPQLEKAPGQTIAKEAGIPLGELDPVGGVAGRDSYEKLLLWNVDQLDKALK